MPVSPVIPPVGVVVGVVVGAVVGVVAVVPTDSLAVSRPLSPQAQVGRDRTRHHAVDDFIPASFEPAGASGQASCSRAAGLMPAAARRS